MTIPSAVPPFVAACRQRRATTGDRIAQIETICIPTANRIPAFTRAARSYLANAKTFGRGVELVVADDSADPGVRAEYQSILAALSREFSAPVWYAGAEEKRSYLVHLAREASVSPELVEFALFDPFNVGYHPGANRNALLLQTAGRPFFCADDDTLCRTTASKAAPRSLCLSDTHDPTFIRPYESFESLEKELNFVETDILGEHARALGSDIGTLLNETSDVVVEIRNPVMMRAIHENAVRVVLSWSGIAGDCGYKIPGFLFDLPEAEMRRFTRDEVAYRCMLTSRQIHRGCERLTITPGGYCQSTTLALDNRSPLPAFLPVFRGEDMTFGQVLKLFQPNSAMAYQPMGVLHVPQVPRENSGAVLAGMGRHHSQMGLIGALIQFALAGKKDPGPPDVGHVVRQVRGILADDLFELLAVNNLRNEIGKMIRTYLLRRFKHRDAPAYWRQDVEAVVRTMHASVERQEYLHPAELAESHPLELRTPVLKAVIVRYFELLEAWPTLWTAALRLREKRGVTPARKLDPM